jgi:prepilin-type N-terminal cleavage/methylation domain-containing protein
MQMMSLRCSYFSDRSSQRGFTIVEVVIALAATAVVFGLYSSAVTDAVTFSAHNVGSAGLHEVGRRALAKIAADISSTGRFQDPSGVPMPHVFSNGLSDPRLPAPFEHDLQALAAIAATFPAPSPPVTTPQNPPPFVAPGFELMPLGIREIVLRLPADMDSDGRPVSAVTGAIEWNPDYIGWILRPNAQGVLDLVRRVVDPAGGVRDETVCRWVEALTFDTTATLNLLPANAVEIHLHLLRKDTQNRRQRLHLSSTVVMRNTP